MCMCAIKIKKEDKEKKISDNFIFENIRNFGVIFFYVVIIDEPP